MSLKRLFAAGSVLPHDMMVFRSHEKLTAPENWSLEAVETFEEALAPAVPVARQAIEENTLPSWLWQHRTSGKETLPETHVMDVFDRIAGAATYRGWKKGLWKNEVEASAFYDEVRALLLTRRLLLAPKDMARMGLDWAYGLEAAKPAQAACRLGPSEKANLILQNETIDSILSGRLSKARHKWLSFLEESQRKEKASIAFVDTLMEWNVLPSFNDAPRAMLNLLAFRHEDGSIDVAGLAQAADVATLLLELHYGTLAVSENSARPLALGFGNLAGLLMSLGLAYDSQKGRSTASALAALVTAAANLRSARLAAKLGACKAFVQNRENVLRNLENQIRAAFGEKTDYDRLSVLPQTLDLGSGVDLVLLSAARHAYEQAIDAIRAQGLRHLQVTALFHDPAFLSLMESFSMGIDPEAALRCAFAIDADTHEMRLNPAVTMGMAQLGYDAADLKAARNHVLGYRTLIAAPGLSHTDLREKGFDDAALAKIEATLAGAAHIKQAFTPWILGEKFCRSVLKLSAETIKKPSLDLLRKLGFTQKDIEIANRFCCGHERLQNLTELAEKDRAVFATRDDLAPEALIKMAAAVQSFVLGDVDLTLSIPASITAQVRGELLLMGWRHGLRSMTLAANGLPLEAKQDKAAEGLLRRQTTSQTAKHAAAQGRKKAMSTPPQRGPKATSRTVVLKSRAGGKVPLKEKSSQ